MASSEADDEIEVDVSISNSGLPRGTRIFQRVKICFDQRITIGRLRASRVRHRSTLVAENSRVDAVGEVAWTEIGKGADPVIACRLVSVKNERIALSSKNLNGIYFKRGNINAVDLNDSLGQASQLLSAASRNFMTNHDMSVDGKGEVGVTGNRDKTEPIPLPCFNGDYSQWRRWAG